MRRSTLAVAALTLAALLALQAGEAFAAAGSGGSRGSRSSSTPARPAPTSPTHPSSPSRQLSSPTPAPAQPSRGRMGGLMGGLAGFALGGLLGSMLFGGMGGGFGGGIGLLELVLIGGAIFLVFRMLRGRGESRPEPAYAGGSSYGSAGQGWSTGGGGAVMETPSSPSELDRGIGHIRGMDASFDPDAFAEWAKGTFIDVQAGIVKRDLSGVQDRLTPQEFGRLQAQCDQLRAARRTHRIERAQFGRAEVSEAWQESGQDWVTVYF